jgi:hypothetical protein
MNIIFLLIGIVGAVALLRSLHRPSTPPPIIYVPTVVTSQPERGMGCLSLVAVGMLVVLALVVVRL